MAFKKFFERKILSRTLTIVILILFLMSLSSIVSNSSVNLNKQFIFFSSRSSSIQNLQTQTILDDQNRLHIFLRENFVNGSFVIYHIFGSQTTKIFQGEYAEDYWKTELSSEGIVLFFAFKTYFGHYTFNVYVWNDTSSEIKTLYSYDPRWKTPKYYFYIEDGIYHLLLAEIVSTQVISEISQTLVKHYAIAENGNMNVTKMYLDLDFPGLQQLIWHNGTLYAFYAIHPSYQTTYDFVLLEFNSNMTDVSVVNWLHVSEGPFSSWVYISSNSTFYLVLQQSTDLFITQFNYNISVSFKNLTKISPGLLSINSMHGFAFDDHLALFMYSDLYIYYSDFFDKKQTRLDLAVIHWSNSNITIEHFSLSSKLQDPKYYSLSVYVAEDDSYILTQSTAVSSNDINDLQVREKQLIGISIITTYQELSSLQVQYYHLTPVSDLQLFWEHVGLKLVIALGIIILFVVIFHKSVRKSFRRLKAYLTRRVDSKKRNVIALIFLNIWAWITNFFGVIFILFKTNKKRHLITLIGLSLFTIVLTTSFMLYDSKKQSVLLEYADNIDFLNNKSPSITISRSYNVQAFSEIEPFDSNFTAKVFSEIFGTIVGETGVLERIISGYEYSLSAEMILTPEISSNTRLVFDYCSISHTYQGLLNALLINGSFPETTGQVLISEDLASLATVQENSTVYLWGSNYLWNLGSDYLNASITGVYHKPSEQELMKLCLQYNVPYDAVMFLTEPYVCLTWHENFEEHFSGFYPYKMPLSGNVQFAYDFSKMTVDDVNYLINEVNRLIDNNYHFFKWLSSGYWVYGQELKLPMESFQPKIASSQFLFFLLAIPLLFLSLLMINETNALFRASYEADIELFQSKGLSNTRIISQYSVIKTIEAIIAASIAIVASLIITPPLLRVEKLFSLKNTHVSLSLTTLPYSFILSVVSVLLIVIPNIVKLCITTDSKERPPRKLLIVLKKFRVFNLLLVALGVGIIFGAVQLNKFFSTYATGVNSYLLMVFIYLGGVGLMIALFGAGLLLQDFYHVMLTVFSKIIWKFKKNMATFSLINIRSDIKLFSGIMLSYVVVTSIIFPAFIAPNSIEYNFVKDTYFTNGADLYVDNWLSINQSLRSKIESLTGVESTSVVYLVNTHYQGTPFYFYILRDPLAFLVTAYQPPKSMFKDWRSAIISLTNNNSMLVSSPFDLFESKGASTFAFEFTDSNPPQSIEFQITGVFDYFPIFYSRGPYHDGDSKLFGIAMSEANFMKFNQSLVTFGAYRDRLLIKTSSDANISEIRQKLEDDWGLDVIVSKEDIDNLMFEHFPFYGVVAAEFMFSIFFTLIAAMFINVSHPVKFVQVRASKHDRLKKYGLSTKKIVRLSIAETMLGAVIPGLLIGTLTGFLLIAQIMQLVKKHFYEGIAFGLFAPNYVFYLAFLGFPLLFLMIFYPTLRTIMVHYEPSKME